MNARFLDMLHNAADICIRAVTDAIDVYFDRIGEIGVNQQRRVSADVHGFIDVPLETLVRMDDFHCPPAQNI